MIAARTLYIHPVTYVTLDYGDELDREHGLAYSWDNNPGAAFCFERQGRKAREEKIEGAVRGDFGTAIRCVRGEHIEHRCDYNPHGLV